MDVEKLQVKIRAAEEAVKEIKDSELKKKAFEIVLNRLLLSVEEKTVTEKSEPREEKNSQDSRSETDGKKEFNPTKLIEATKLTAEQLGNVIDFDEGNFHVVATIPGKSYADQQKNAALLVLTANYYCSGEREYDAGKLRKRLEDLGIKSLMNMATILKNYENHFVKKGDAGSRSTVYRITNPGLQEGINLMKRLGEKRD